MKKCSKLSKAILALVTFVFALVPALCFADTMPGGSSPLWDMFQGLSFSPPTGDVSIGFLTKMFGAVPGVPALSAGGQTVIGIVFSVFNIGVLALSGVFLSYTITRILTETTMDGAAIGKSTTIWTAVRCSLSTSLLVPQASGYSLINSIVMWVVVQSVGLADLTWSHAVAYLKTGGSTYAQPTSQVNYSFINYDVSAGKALDKNNSIVSAGSTDVLRSLTCAYTVHNALTKSQTETRDRLNEKASKGSLTLDEQTELANASRSIPEDSDIFSLYKHFPCDEVGYDSAKCGNGYGVFQFPYIKDEQTNPLKDYGLNMDSIDIPTNLTGICGSIGYAEKTNGKSGRDRNVKYAPEKLQGLQNMIAIVQSAAEQIAKNIQIDSDTNERGLDINNYKLYDKKGFFKNNNAENKYDSSNLTIKDFENEEAKDVPTINWPAGSDAVLSAAAAYQIALSGAQEKLQEAIDDGDKKVKKYTEKGWVAAGGYYRILAQKLNSEVEEFNGQRLRGYQDRYTPIDASSNPRYNEFNARYDTMFGQKGGKNTTFPAIESINKASKDDLAEALKWIYVSYPYAKLRGEMLAYSLTKSTTFITDEKALTAVKATVRVLQAVGALSVESSLMYLQISGVALLVLIPPAGAAILTPVAISWLVYDIANILVTWWETMLDSHMDPILKLQVIGDAMITGAVSYYTQMMLMFTTIAIGITTATLTMTYVSGAAAAFSMMGAALGVSSFADTMTEMYNQLMDFSQSLIFMALPMGLAIMGPIFISGVTFSIYVPLIPYLLFLFGVMSWLISVLVLMAAAPIICFLMLWGNSSQENPLLAREAEQFVMQIVGVFFRPTLMIIGLVTGMVLSYIGVDLLNLGFMNMFEIVMGSNWTELITNALASNFSIIGAVSSATLGIVKLAGVIIVYTFTMVSIVNMSFSPIYLLYSEAMRIAGISAPATGMEEKQSESVKGGLGQFSEAAAAGFKEQATSLKGAGVRYKGGGAESGAGAEGEGGDNDGGGDSNSPLSGAGGSGGGNEEEMQKVAEVALL